MPAPPNSQSEPITTTGLALAQLPKLAPGPTPLGGTDAFIDWLSCRSRWLSDSVGMTITDAIHQAVLKIPKKAWTPAYDAGCSERTPRLGREDHRQPRSPFLTEGHATDR